MVTALGKTIIRLKSLMVSDIPIPSIIIASARGKKTEVKTVDSIRGFFIDSRPNLLLFQKCLVLKFALGINHLWIFNNVLLS